MKRVAGFTIVELLIVIVIVAILAAISIVAYTGIQARARASAIASDIKATEKAFQAYKISSGASTWWVDTDPVLSGSSSGNPGISAIMTAQPEFRNYLSTAPSITGLSASSQWFYDYDNDTYNGCSASTGGVNLGVYNPTAMNVVQALDNAMDDGNLSCGKLRMASDFLLYSLN